MVIKFLYWTTLKCSHKFLSISKYWSHFYFPAHMISIQSFPFLFPCHSFFISIEKHTDSDRENAQQIKQKKCLSFSLWQHFNSQWSCTNSKLEMTALMDSFEIVRKSWSELVLQVLNYSPFLVPKFHLASSFE